MAWVSFKRTNDESASPHVLTARWMMSLGARLGTDQLDIADVAADVVDTLLERPSELHGALARFGRRLGAEGWLLGDLSAWIDELAALAGDEGLGLRNFEAGISLGQGWADGFVHGSRSEECVDGLTGLATSAVLQLRLSQVFDQCRALGISPEMAYTVVVVDADVVGLPPLVRDAAWVVLADHVWTVFSTGETVCRAGDRILVLAANSPELQDRIGQLSDRLRDVPMLDGVSIMTWTEQLPRERGHLDGFLLDLVG
jgi:hypothetical protein